MFESCVLICVLHDYLCPQRVVKVAGGEHFIVSVFGVIIFCLNFIVKFLLRHAGTWVVSNVSGASLNYWNMSTISDSRGCSDNHEGITPIYSETLKPKRSSSSALLAACKMWCSSEEHCVAIDYFRKTRLCNLYSRACAKPLATHDGASSYKIAQANKYARADAHAHTSPFKQARARATRV